MIRRPPRSTQSRSSAASDVYKRQIDYMAPEQIRAEEVSAATDVYALGCVMCECMSGAPPFADRKGMRVLWAHLQDEPPDPCANRPDAPRELSAAIRHA